MNSANEPDTDVSLSAQFDNRGLMDLYATIRNGMKQQLKSLREMQGSLDSRWVEALDRIERIRSAVPSSIDGEVRSMAYSLAEIEESLERAVSCVKSQTDGLRPNHELAKFVTSAIDAWNSKQPGWRRWLTRKLTDSLTKSMLEFEAMKQSDANRLDSFHRGLELLLERVRRIMRQHDIERIDVFKMDFDPDRMNATDVIETRDVASGQVAEQIRPLYLWKNQVLSVAEVRVAK